MARVISDRTIKALLKGHPPDDAKFDRWGKKRGKAGQPGVGIRWSSRDKVEKLHRLRPFGDKKNPVQLLIRIYGAATDSQARVFTLADARAEADRWRNQGRAGKDPKADHARALRARQRHTASTFEKAAEEFFKVKERPPHERRATKSLATFGRNSWAGGAKRPDRRHRARGHHRSNRRSPRDRGSPYQAYNLLGYARRLFDWAVIKYDLEKSPCDRLRPRDMFRQS